MNLKKAQISELFTTSNALGSFKGNQVPNLQIRDLDPGEYTLQFQQVESVIDGLGQATYAIIRWKVEGQQIQRIVSVFSGAVITGVAEAVDVQLLDQSGRGVNTFTATATVTPGSRAVPLTGPVNLQNNELIYFTSQPGIAYSLAVPVTNGTQLVLTSPYTGPGPLGTTFFAQAQYKVGVILSRGTRPTIMQPPTLLTVQPARAVAAGTFSLVQIPQDAGIISVLSTVIVDGLTVPQAEAANGVVQFLNANVTAPPGFVSAYIPQTFAGWYPIPAGSDTLLLKNHSTTQKLDFSIQWGIEG